MSAAPVNFGIVDKKFLSKSVGLLNPREPLVIRENDSIKSAIDTLKSHKVGCVIIVNDEQKLVGIFTERDVTLKVAGSEMNLSTTLISEVMTPAPHTEQMTTTLAFALNMMSEGGYRHIPIVDDENCPIGIISVKDIVDYIVATLNKDLVAFV